MYDSWTGTITWEWHDTSTDATPCLDCVWVNPAGVDRVQPLRVTGNEITIKDDRRCQMRAYYEVIIIDPDREKVILEKRVIARDEQDALIEADVLGALKERGLKTSDVDKIVRKLGDVRPAKEVRYVKVEK